MGHTVHSVDFSNSLNRQQLFAPSVLHLTRSKVRGKGSCGVERGEMSGTEETGKPPRPVFVSSDRGPLSYSAESVLCS